MSKSLMPVLCIEISIVANIVCEYGEVGMSHADALAVRLALMKERKFFIDHHNEIWERKS
jgi:hypothetical protein